MSKFIQITFSIYHFSFQPNKKIFQLGKTKISFISYFFVSLSIFYLPSFYTPTKQSLREPLLRCKIGGNCNKNDLRYWRRSISLQRNRPNNFLESINRLKIHARDLQDKFLRKKLENDISFFNWINTLAFWEYENVFAKWIRREKWHWESMQISKNCVIAYFLSEDRFCNKHKIANQHVKSIFLGWQP